MESHSDKNRRVAKNTLYLYIRSIAVMVVGLFTSRVILNTLGVENYGIYNVIGGTISFLSILTGSLSAAISRFITFGLGTKDEEKLKVTFSTCVSIQLALAVIILLIAEVGGLWMLYNKLNIPVDKLSSAFWVLQFSIATFIVGMISVPYEACIIAHEEMKIFAYIALLDVILKLIFVCALYFTSSYFNTLITYSFLLFLISLILRVIYGLYCKKKFEECNYKFVVNTDILKEIFSFSAWSFLGNTAYIFNTQGVNILINIFFGVTLNAARGIVSQVEGAIMKFVDNFTTAITPQVTKSYASENKEYMFTLICRGTKFSYFLMLFFLIPLELETDAILKLWLGFVPEYTVIFLRLSLLGTVTILLGSICLKAIFATGIIRNYQITVTLVGCLVFPITWILYRIGCPAYTTYIVYILIYGILNYIRLVFMRNLLGFPIRLYLTDVAYPAFTVSLFALIIPLIIYLTVDQSLIRLITVGIISIPLTSMSIYFFGLKYGERTLVRSKIRSIISQFVH